jgi:pyruvate-ferredoxin/flavodoxin oxidoreductase
MGKSQDQIKKAVEAGYWHLSRYNPNAEKKFTLDSKEPKASFREFIMGEVRYASLQQDFPQVAESLFEQTEREAKERYETYKTMAELGQQPVKA